MENNTLFQVNTAWSFPVLKYTTNTSYVEVRKASGIAYILLQLISNSDNNDEKLIAMLKNFGVPSDIHYIFASELANMINYGIIQIKSGRDYSSDLIDLYAVSDFMITELGRKLFAEGTIPTGNNSVKKIQLYYDVSKKDTLVKCDWKMFRIENSALDESCVGETILDESDVEMFINDNMTQFSFRKGERISGFEHEEPEIFVYKIDDAVTIRISPENMSIIAKDKSRDLFIHKYYSTDIITRIMQAKRKYQFPDKLITDDREYEYDSIGSITKVYMPSQISMVTNVKSPLAFEGSFEIKGSQCIIDKEISMELLKKCEIQGDAAYFEDDNLFSIIPGKFYIPVEGYSDKCALNLIVVKKVENEVRQQLLNELFFKCIEPNCSLDGCKIVIQITKLSQCKDYLEQFANFELKKYDDYTEKINHFLKLNEEFTKMSEWQDYSKKTAEILLEDICQQVTIEGFNVQNGLGKKLNKILALNDIDFLRKLSKKLIIENGDVVTFEIMENSGYSADILLSVANIFELYCNMILNAENISGNSKISGQCALLGQSLHELKELTGIYNPIEDAAEIDFDNERFIQVMATFSDLLKKLEKYKAYSLNQYKQLEAYYDRFIEIKEVVTIEKEALKNPKNINKGYIEQRLRKSKYKDAICDLHVRLQYELNRLFETTNMPTFELLTDSEISQYLTEQEINDMHTLRKCRNGFQHPKDKREVKYSETKIREWCAIVEKLGGMVNESRSED